MNKWIKTTSFSHKQVFQNHIKSIHNRYASYEGLLQGPLDEKYRGGNFAFICLLNAYNALSTIVISLRTEDTYVNTLLATEITKISASI